MGKVVKAAIVVAGIATGVGMLTAGIAGGASFSLLGSTLFGAGTIGAFFARQFVSSLVLGLLSNSMTKSPAGGVGGTTVTSRSAVAPRQVIYGKTRLGGTVVYMEGTEQNKYLHSVIVFSGHEIDGFEKLYFNDEEVIVDLPSGNVTTGKYANKVKIALVNGTDTQAAFADLVAASAGKWTANHRLLGCSAIYVRLEYDQDIFPSGVPNVSVLLRGKKVYDPRTGLTAWSQNPALCLNDYLTNSEYGIGCSYATEIDSSALIAAANICDENVPLAEGGTEKAYQINGAFQTSAAPEQVINAILSSMIGKAIWTGGKWRILAGAYYTPSLSFDESDLRGGIKVQANVSRRENFNSIKGTHISIAENYIATDFPAVIGDGTTNATMANYVAQDNGEVVYKTIVLPFTTSATMAQRIAKIELERARQQITVSLPLKLVGLKANVGDVILLDNERMGWVQKPFEVVSMGITYTEELGVDMELRETAAEVFNWNSGIDQKDYDPAPNTNLPNPFVVAAPTNLIVTPTTQINNDGTMQPLFQLTWTASVDKFVNSYEVQWKRNAYGTLPAEAEFNSVVVASTAHTISGINTGALYDIQVRAITALNVRSPWLSVVSLSNAGDTIAPAPPTGLTITNNELRSCYLQWVNPPDEDYFQTIIYASFTNNSATAGEVGRVSGTSQTYSGLLDSTTYYVWLKSVDYSGNVSGFNTGPTAGTSFTTRAPVVDGVDGADGADGATGPRSAELYFFNNIPSATAPTASATYFDYDFAGNPSVTSTGASLGWSTTLTINPITNENGANNKYWAVKCIFRETVFGGGDATPDMYGPFTWQNFDGLVTFTNLANGTNENGAADATIIDGSCIQTGTISCNTLQSNTAFSPTASNIIFGLGSDYTVNGFKSAGYFNSTKFFDGAYKFALTATSTYGTSFASAHASNLGYGGAFFASPTTAYSSYKTAALLAGANIGGRFENINATPDIFVEVSNNTYGVQLFGSTVGPFTGSHDGLIPKTEVQPEIGDIVVDVSVYAKPNINDSICVNAISTVANQKGVVGVFSKYASENHIPSSLATTILDDSNNNSSIIDPSYTDIDVYNKIIFNALGEGLINVCGEGGDIEIGDLIVTSSIAGKGMKQSDDIIRGITVAKSRERVTFSGPTEVKQIACIYISG